MWSDLSVRMRTTVLRASLLVGLFAGVPVVQGAVLLSQQTSVVADSIKAEAQQCATGDTPGTIGNAIKNALNIHTQLASAMPNTEALFSPVGDCFSNLLGTWDLSFAIPSLSSIRDAVANALVKYAKKTVCTAVDQARSMVTTPINQAISGLTSGTGMGGIGDLNGLSNGLMAGQLATIDPNLGYQYTSAQAGTKASYDVNLNPFSATALDFGGTGTTTTATSGTAVSSSGAVSQISTSNSQISTVNTQLANYQVQVGPAQQAVSTAQSNLSSCQSQSYNNCSSYQSALQSAQSQLNSINSSISSLKSQLSGYSTTSSSGSSTTSSGTGLVDRLSSYFN